MISTNVFGKESEMFKWQKCMILFTEQAESLRSFFNLQDSTFD